MTSRYPVVRARRRRGSSILEFALSFTFLFTLMAGAFQFGYTFYVFNALRNGVREGARYASWATYKSNSNSFPSAYGTAVKNMTVYGNPAGTGAPLVKGLTTSNVEVRVTFSSNVPTQVQVSIKDFTVDGVFKSFRFNKPVAVFPYTGRYAPDGV